MPAVFEQAHRFVLDLQTLKVSSCSTTFRCPTSSAKLVKSELSYDESFIDRFLISVF
jgi:hypothetical protein